MIRRSIVTLIAVMIVGLSMASLPRRSVASAEPDVAGRYDCDGTNPEGHPYHGTVEIIAHGRRFEVRWTLPPQTPGGEPDVIVGIGLIVDGRLSVAYHIGAPAIVVYRVTAATPLTLSGQWAIPHAPGVYLETLTKTPPSAKPAPSRDGERKG